VAGKTEEAIDYFKEAIRIRHGSTAAKRILKRPCSGQKNLSKVEFDSSWGEGNSFQYLRMRRFSFPGLCQIYISQI
jgi:hypothetical protein